MEKLDSRNIAEIARYFHPKAQIVTTLPKPKDANDKSEVLIKGTDGNFTKYQMLEGKWRSMGTTDFNISSTINTAINKVLSALGITRTLFFPFTYLTTDASSILDIIPNDELIIIKVSVITAFNGTDPLLALYEDTGSDLICDGTQVDLTRVGNYDIIVGKKYTDNNKLDFQLVNSGTPTTGAGLITINVANVPTT